MISTWNIKKFSRCKIFLHENGQSNPNHNLWNHFSDANLSIIFLLNNIRNDNYGTLRVIRKDYQNVLETICLTKQNIEILNFKLLKKDNLIGIQYKTEDEEMIMQFVFFNNNDSLSFFTFLSPYMPYEILPDDYKVVEETVTSQNITSSFSTFSSPIHSTNASMENQVLSLVDKSNKIMNESQIHATATFENQQAFINISKQ
ncbi:hypothetical protein BCR36DRAFT_55469 [Piromyces finnis]|uniref:Uncharacterized protein n=1 Tax=Piromyces finnis TaxID=1754191 RepID=A0A1Y1VAL5_9FUNG|nr:hypothetical protein BCR36DRAFT_55469 [Piromyces finnis]|eukprot:ORX50725.1 hypothetical protein BCR36DRAFT_55469 [Piromyces finnis]